MSLRKPGTRCGTKSVTVSADRKPTRDGVEDLALERRCARYKVGSEAAGKRFTTFVRRALKR
jgi:hypothetical protein